MGKTEYYKKLSVRIPVRHLEMLELQAVHNGVTISDVVRWLLQDALEPTNEDYEPS